MCWMINKTTNKATNIIILPTSYQTLYAVMVQESYGNLVQSRRTVNNKTISQFNMYMGDTIITVDIIAIGY